MTLRRLTQGVNQNSLYRRAPFSLSQPYGKCLSGTPAGPLRRLGTGPADGRIMLPPPIFNMYCCGWQCTRPDWDLAGESVISLSETPPSAAHWHFPKKARNVHFQFACHSVQHKMTMPTMPLRSWPVINTYTHPWTYVVTPCLAFWPSAVRFLSFCEQKWVFHLFRGALVWKGVNEWERVTILRK